MQFVDIHFSDDAISESLIKWNVGRLFRAQAYPRGTWIARGHLAHRIQQNLCVPLAALRGQYSDHSKEMMRLAGLRLAAFFFVLQESLVARFSDRFAQRIKLRLGKWWRIGRKLVDKRDRYKLSVVPHSKNGSVSN